MPDTRPTHSDKFNDGSATDGTVIIDQIWDSIEAIQTSGEVLANKGVPNGYVGLDANGDPIGAVTPADLAAAVAALQAQIDALGGGGGGGGVNQQVVPMGVYSASGVGWDRTIALVGDARWTIPLVRWFSAGMDDTLVTAKADIDSATRTLLINMPAKISGGLVPWTAITAGTYDSQITAFFTALATFASTNIYVTPVDEPDGTVNGQGQSAASYFAMFDHVKAIANAVAPNVKLGLSLAVASRMATWAHAAYDFIDWNPYNWNTPWTSFAAIMQRDYPTLAAQGKPLIVTTGSVENPNDPSGPNSKQAWYQNLGNTLLAAAANYPLLSQVYIWDAGTNPNFHVDTSTPSLNGYKTLIATDFTAGAPPSSITPNPAAITKGVSAVAGTTVSATVASVIPVGHHVVVVVEGSGNPGTVTVADSGGNTYTAHLPGGIIQNTSAAKTFVAILSAKVTTQLNLGASITATLGSSQPTKEIAGLEVTGLNGTTWFDQHAAASGNSASPDSGATALTSGAGLVVAGGAMALPLAFDPLDDANGHALTVIDASQIGSPTNRAVASGYALTPGAETAHGVFNSHGNSGQWSAGVVVFKT